MTLRDDVRWLRDVVDGMLVGWVFGRPPPWTTKEGEKLSELVQQLYRKWYEKTTRVSVLEAENHQLRNEVDAQRWTNERLTERVEALECRKRSETDE